MHRDNMALLFEYEEWQLKTKMLYTKLKTFGENVVKRFEFPEDETTRTINHPAVDDNQIRANNFVGFRTEN